MTHLRIAAFATAFGAALGASNAAHATFVIDRSCGEAKCDAGTDFFIDVANSDVSTFSGKVQGNAITVDTTGNVDTGSGFATIKPVKGGALTDLLFTPSDDTLFSDFSFRGQLEPAGFTGTVDITGQTAVGQVGRWLPPGSQARTPTSLALESCRTTAKHLKSVMISTPGWKAQRVQAGADTGDGDNSRQFRKSQLGQ